MPLSTPTGVNVVGVPTTNQVPTYNGAAWVPGTPRRLTLDITGTASDLVNPGAATQSNIYSFAIPGGTMGANGLIHIQILGFHELAGGGGTTWGIDWGGATAVLSSNDGHGVDATIYATSIDVYIQNQNATGSQYAWMNYIYANAVHLTDNNASLAAQDTTASKTLTVWWKPGTANASNFFKRRSAFTEVIS